jgi:hypothetical protein
MTSESIPKCPACGGSVLDPGSLAAVGGTSFKPDRTGYGLVDGVRAMACLDCGHVSLWLRSFDLSGLRKARNPGQLKPRE